MNKHLKIGLVIAFVLIVGSVTTVLAGGTNDPGSVNDPVVTKSYVDEQINKLAQSGAISSGSGETSGLLVLTLEKGDILIGKSGTEMILRGGVAVIYGEGNDGVPDITTGIDVGIGKNVTKNHQLIFPRNDGRGLKITKGPAYVMLKGNYEIIKSSN